MSMVIGIVSSHKLTEPRLTYEMPNEDGNPYYCFVCGKLHTLKIKLHEEFLLGVACNLCVEHTDWHSACKPRTEMRKELDSGDLCPECNGRAKIKGSGYLHKKHCSKKRKKKLEAAMAFEAPESKTKRVCEFCQGPAKGRGFMHKEDCETKKGNR